MKVLGLIPARGGSKGVPGKNIKIIDGKPLISYTIESALSSKLIDELWVSSDNKEILEISQAFTNVKLHNREAFLAQDDSPIADTVKIVWKLAESLKGNYFDALMLLQPTAPIRDPEHIDNAIIALSQDEAANSLISVCAMQDIHPARMYWKKNNRLQSSLPEYEQTRRQDIPPAYYRNGSMYMVKRNAFFTNGVLIAKPVLPFEMPLSYLLNIDEPQDIFIAEALIPAWKKGMLL